MIVDSFSRFITKLIVKVHYNGSARYYFLKVNICDKVFHMYLWSSFKYYQVLISHGNLRCNVMLVC